ncbi:MAG: phosphoglycerate kinase [Candidatus Aenigmarchaeota archaeon]|nr:phosphoglycerate kinase [Candidatus Aenigmarchaeota archaeon]
MDSSDFLTMDDFDLAGKTVLLRVDINAPAKDGKIQVSDRMVEHAKTISELSRKGAKVVVLGHQGRAGETDFLPLEEHAAILSKLLKRRVKYVDDVLGSHARTEVKKLSPGKIILLENLRFLAEETLEVPPEEHAKSFLVKVLSSQANVFVNDAFSVSHRAQASVVGFPEVMPSCAGRIMEKEYYSLIKATSQGRTPVVYVLGGAKADDCFNLMKNALEKKNVNLVLTSGVLGELLLIASGADLKATQVWLEKEGFTKLLPRIKEVYGKYSTQIILPSDFACEENGERIEIPLERLADVKKPVFDIGSATAEHYAAAIGDAGTVYFKGPCGTYENPLFEKGTKLVLKAIERGKAFSIMGGGHTLDALESLGINKNKISHISVAGGALLSFLSGEPLPGIEALKKAKARGNSK